MYRESQQYFGLNPVSNFMGFTVIVTTAAGREAKMIWHIRVYKIVHGSNALSEYNLVFQYIVIEWRMSTDRHVRNASRLSTNQWLHYP